MNITAFIIKYMVIGICIGATLYITSWTWTRPLKWVTDALEGKLKN
jgi:hypothetical protein